MKNFLSKFDRDIQENLRLQLAVLWTYTSNAIEGNTLSLGETDYLIRQGIAIVGKPIKDMNDALAHYSAVNLIYDMASSSEKITDKKLFAIHKHIMTEKIIDIYHPIGAWKTDPNGTYYQNEETGRAEWHDYPALDKIPTLMDKWITNYNSLVFPDSIKAAIKQYAYIHNTFVSIHPFADGNGRMARLLANIPLLKVGYAPLVIDTTRRKEYISLIVQFQKNPSTEIKLTFEKFLTECYSKTLEIIKNAEILQAKRQQERNL